MAFSITFHSCSEDLKASVNAILSDWFSKVDAFEAKTSGSTGPPKRIEFSRNQIVASAKRTNHFFQLNENSSVLLALSPETIGGKMILYRALIGDYSVHVTPASQYPLKQIPETIQFDFVSLAPIQISHFEAHQFNRFKRILLGGAPLSQHLETKLSAVSDTMYMGFGMSETLSHIAIRKLGNPVYECLHGATVSENNGKLIVQDRELEITDLHTNDEVKLIDSTHFEWLGRSDFTINSGGVKIHPEILESHLTAVLPYPFIIAAVPDEELGDKCVLIVEAPEASIDLESIQALCKELGKYCVPKSIFYHSIVRMDNQKINRRATVSQILED